MKNNIRTWMEKDSLLRERCVKTRKIHAKKIKTRQTHRDPWVINALADSFVLFSFTQTTNGWGRVRQSFVITEQRVFLFHHSNPWYPDAPSTHLLKLLMLILFYEFLFLHTTLCNERKWNFLYSFWCPKNAKTVQNWTESETKSTKKCLKKTLSLPLNPFSDFSPLLWKTIGTKHSGLTGDALWEKNQVHESGGTFVLIASSQMHERTIFPQNTFKALVNSNASSVMYLFWKEPGKSTLFFFYKIERCL